MIKRLAPSLLGRVRKEFWSLSPASSLYFLIVLFLPAQFGRHFWPSFSFVSGLRVDYLSPTLYVTDILIILLFISFIQRTIGLWPRFLSKLPLPLVLLSISLLVGIFLSKLYLAGLLGLLRLAEFFFFGFYTAKNIRNLKLVIYALFIGVVFESVLAILQYFNQGSLGSIFYFFGERTFNSQTPGIANASLNGSLVLRPYATFSHPNVLAAYLIVSMTLVLFYFKKALKYPLLFLGTTALILTLSRVAILIWVPTLFIWIGGKFWKSSKTKIIFFFIAAAVLMYVSPLSARLSSLSLVDEGVVSRISLSKAAINMFLDKPILGVGVNNFLINLPFYIKPTGNVFYLQPVHNIFLLVLAETGITGFGFFMWFLLKTYKRILKRKFMLGLVLISEVLFLGFFDHYFLTLQQGQLLFTLVLGICWSRLRGISRS